MGKGGKASKRYINNDSKKDDNDEDIGDQVVKRYNATFSVLEENPISSTVPLEFANQIEGDEGRKDIGEWMS